LIAKIVGQDVEGIDDEGFRESGTMAFGDGRDLRFWVDDYHGPSISKRNSRQNIGSFPAACWGDQN
jgi:hypothetical protein